MSEVMEKAMSEGLKKQTEQASDNLRWVTNGLRGLLALDEQIGELGSLEQAISERRVTLDELKAEEARLGQEVDQHRARAAEQHKAIVGEIAEAEKRLVELKAKIAQMLEAID